MTEHHSEGPDEGPKFIYSAKLESNGTDSWCRIEIVIGKKFDWKKDEKKLLREVRAAFNLFFKEPADEGEHTNPAR